MLPKLYTSPKANDFLSYSDLQKSILIDQHISLALFFINTFMLIILAQTNEQNIICLSLSPPLSSPSSAPSFCLSLSETFFCSHPHLRVRHLHCTPIFAFSVSVGRIILVWKWVKVRVIVVRVREYSEASVTLYLTGAAFSEERWWLCRMLSGDTVIGIKTWEFPKSCFFFVCFVH